MRAIYTSQPRLMSRTNINIKSAHALYKVQYIRAGPIYVLGSNPPTIDPYMNRLLVGGLVMGPNPGGPPQ